jgi:eukaryotic-like serine/threonine-protein kinase
MADDGSVKIGDFGLSIPSRSDDATRLTRTGIVLGTPGFCSPEQLRGEDLDVRSDIYSVGSTLFFLLTGHDPIGASDPVRAIANTLEQPPESLDQWRGDVPAGLVRLVAECLEKSRELRPQTYEDLRGRLGRYSHGAFTTAPPHLRFPAGCVDVALLLMLWNPVLLVLYAIAYPAATPSPTVLTVASALTVIGIFGVLEGSTGTSPGKHSFSIRVAAADGSPPSLPRVLMRAAIWYAPIYSGIWYAAIWALLPAQYVGVFQAEVRYERSSKFFPDPLPLISWHVAVGVVVLFAFARKQNGYRGIHERWGLTRTALARVPSKFPVPLATPTASELPLGRDLGPYALVLNPSQELAPFPYQLALDVVLSRYVWMRLGEPEPPAVRRDLHRRSRLRWIGGRHPADGNWDAYEYPAGQSFLDAVERKPSVTEVTRWLATLVEELETARRDGTLETISLDYLWIAENGELKVLDWPRVVSSPGACVVLRSVNDTELQRFISNVAATALGQGVLHAIRPPWPLALSALLNRLSTGGFESLSGATGAIRDVAATDFEVSRLRRGWPLLLMGALLLGGATNDMMGFLRMRAELNTDFQASTLNVCLEALRRGHSTNRDSDLRCVAARLSHIDPQLLDWFRRDEGRRRLIDEARLLPGPHPQPPPRPVQYPTGSVVDMALRSVVVPLAAIGFATIALTAMLRRGPLFRLSGLAVVDDGGAEASRGRAVLRAVIVWAPVLIPFPVFLKQLPGPLSSANQVVALIALTVMSMGAILVIRSTQRAIAERLSRTWIVRS